MKYVLEGEDMSYIKKMELEALKYNWVISLAQWVPWYPIPDSVMEFLISKIKKGQTNRYSIVHLNSNPHTSFFKKFNRR